MNNSGDLLFQFKRDAIGTNLDFISTWFHFRFHISSGLSIRVLETRH